MKEDRLAASAADPGNHCLAPRSVQVGYHDLRAFTSERHRTGCANSRCAARHDRDLALYLAHNVLRRLWHVLPILCTVVSLLVHG